MEIDEKAYPQGQQRKMTPDEPVAGKLRELVFAESDFLDQEKMRQKLDYVKGGIDMLKAVELETGVYRIVL